MTAKESGRGLGEELRIEFVSRLGAVANSALCALTRMRLVDPPYALRRRSGAGAGRCVYAVWHENLWHGMHALKHQGVHAMVSSHRDGEIIARILRRAGFGLLRGSSTRGGAKALRDLARVARETDDDIVVTIDGPKGPPRVVKEGVLFAASRTGLPIVPMGLAVDRAWRARSWDRIVIGKPGALVSVAFGEELHVPRDARRERLLPEWGPLLAAAMERVERRAGRGEPLA